MRFLNAKKTVTASVVCLIFAALPGCGGGGSASPSAAAGNQNTPTGTVTVGLPTPAPPTPVPAPVLININNVTILETNTGTDKLVTLALDDVLEASEISTIAWALKTAPDGAVVPTLTAASDKLSASFTPGKNGKYVLTLNTNKGTRDVKIYVAQNTSFDVANTSSVGGMGTRVDNQHYFSTALKEAELVTILARFPGTKLLSIDSPLALVELNTSTIEGKTSLEQLKLERKLEYVGNRIVNPAITPSLTVDDGSAFNDGGDNWHLEDIGMPAAWDITTGSAEVVIGVADGGIYRNHDELGKTRVVKVLTNGGGVADKSHGTAVTSAIVGNTNNKMGITAINHVSSAAFSTYHGDSFSAPMKQSCAGYTGVKVTNHSWGLDWKLRTWPESDKNNGGKKYGKDDIRDFVSAYPIDAFSNTLVNWGSARAAVSDQPCLFVKSAGNNFSDAKYDGGALHYKSSGSGDAQLVPLKNLVVVGAYIKNMEHGRVLAMYSNFGDSVDIAAPTEFKAAKEDNVLSDDSYWEASSPNLYGTSYSGAFGGTSAATPVVTGVASLIYAVNPSFTAAEVKQILLESASEFITKHEVRDKSGVDTIQDLPNGQKIPVINAARAVKLAKEIVTGGKFQATAIVVDPFSGNASVNLRSLLGSFISASGVISASETGCFGTINSAKTYSRSVVFDTAGNGLAPLSSAGVQCYAITGKAILKDKQGVNLEQSFSIFKQIVTTRVTARDQVTLAPIAAAAVTLEGFAGSAFTNASGQATLYIEPNWHRLYVNKQFYKETAQYAMINFGYVELSQGVLEVPAYLTQDTVKTVGALSGLVTDSKGAPIKNANVRISGGTQTNGYFASATTDALGRYNLSNLSKTDSSGIAIPAFSMLVSATGYNKVTRDTVIVLDGKTRAENFSLVVGTDTSVVTAYATSFEGTTSWQLSGLWNLPSIAENTRFNSFVDTGYVALAPDEGATKAYLPKARDGASVLWYGQPANGSFIGTQVTGDYLRSGGTSIAANNGRATSPLINLLGVNNPELSFWTWWEIESENPNSAGYDLMDVLISTDNGVTWAPLKRLNPFVDPNDLDRTPKPFSSGGFNRKPVWVNETIKLSAYAGKQVRLRFSFDTIDPYYNAFRGWMIDDLRITGL